jgi:general secretion pathway protein K
MTARSNSGLRGVHGNPPVRQRGIAMLVAILLVALGTIIAAAVAYESAMNARRGTATFSFDEALLVGQGAEALAAYGLRAVRMADKNPTADVYPAQPWGQPVGPLEVVPGVTLEASLEDMQGRFNLNWLVTPPTGGNAAITGKPNATAVAAFTHLLELVGIEPKWTDLLVDWIDADSQAQTDGAEDSTYLGQNPPYLTANMYITSTSELLALPGFGRDRYLKLAPYISALPPDSALNICSASSYVLDAFGPPGQSEWTAGDPSGLEKNRANAGACFPTLAVYQQGLQTGNANQQVVPGNTAIPSFGTTSQYFRLTSLVTIGTTEFNLYSLLLVDKNSPFYIHPIQRSFSAD